jgi:hypothetical protein
MLPPVIVRVGPDPFGRGERTVFYRDASINGGRDVFYMWAGHWLRDYPHIPIPADGHDIEPPAKSRRKPGACVPFVLEPGHPERLSNLMAICRKVEGGQG